jgi:hypothetical protein
LGDWHLCHIGISHDYESLFLFAQSVIRMNRANPISQFLIGHDAGKLTTNLNLNGSSLLNLMSVLYSMSK